MLLLFLQRVLLQVLRFLSFRKRSDVNGLDRERLGNERSAIGCCGRKDLPRLLRMRSCEVEQDAFFGG